MAQEDYDLIIIGSGPGGYVAGIRAGQLGLKVAVVEKDPKFGGTCLHRGCIPTKALLHTAALLDEIKGVAEHGIQVAAPTLDIAKAHDRKRKVVDKNARGIEALFKKYKVTGMIQGTGRLVGPHQVEVDGKDGKRVLSTRFVMIASGSVPRDVPVAKADGERILNSDHILKLERVPKSIAVLGAGAVGTEFASLYASFGSEVTLIEMLPRILPIEDEEISAELERALRKRKIKVLTGARLTAAERTEAGVRLGVERQGKAGTPAPPATVEASATSETPGWRTSPRPKASWRSSTWPASRSGRSTTTRCHPAPTATRRWAAPASARRGRGSAATRWRSASSRSPLSPRRRSSATPPASSRSSARPGTTSCWGCTSSARAPPT